MAGILDVLSTLFRGSTISREVPTTIFPHELPTLPAGVVGTEPEQLSTEPIETTRTISTRRPPALLTFLVDFAAGFGRGGAMPGIQARFQSQQADLDRQMEAIERKQKLEEQRFKENEPRLLNVGGELVITNPLAIKNRDLPNAIIRLSKKQLDPLSFKEEIAKYSSLYDIEFTKEEGGQLYSEFAAYQAQPKEEKDPSKFFRKLGEITKSKGEAKIKEAGFDESFDTAKGALESLGPFDKEEQAQVSAAVANSQLKKNLQPLQTLATSIANKRDIAQARTERGGVADTFRQIQRLNQQANQEDKLRGDYEQEVKQLVSVRDSYDRVASALKEQTPASDLSLIFAYMKMLDPTSVVREGEFATAQNAAAVPDRIRNIYNRVIKGTRMTPEQRADFGNQAKGLLIESTKRKRQADNKYLGIAERRGLNPDNVIRREGFDLEEYSIVSPSGKKATRWLTPEEAERLKGAGFTLNVLKDITRAK